MQDKSMKSLWDAWLITQTSEEIFIKRGLLFYLDWKKYFLHLPCKNTVGASMPFALLDFEKLHLGPTVLITSITNFIYGLIK